MMYLTRYKGILFAPDEVNENGINFTFFNPSLLAAFPLLGRLKNDLGRKFIIFSARVSAPAPAFPARQQPLACI